MGEQAEESEFQTSVPCGEFDQNEETFSVYFYWNITSPKMVRNNILEG